MADVKGPEPRHWHDWRITSNEKVERRLRLWDKARDHAEMAEKQLAAKQGVSLAAVHATLAIYWQREGDRLADS